MCATTDLETEDEEAAREKRKPRPNPVYMDSDSDEPSDLKRKMFCRPPDVGIPGDMSKSWTCQELPQSSQAVRSLEHSREVTTPRSAPGHYGQLRPSQLTRRDLFGDISPRDQFLNESGATCHQLQVPQRENVTMQGSGQLYKDITIEKLTEMVAEVLVVVRGLARDMQFLRGHMAGGIPDQGIPNQDQVPECPIKLPLSNEADLNNAETLLKTEAVRLKMIARLALVGGTSSESMVRRMLGTALTNGLACSYSWAGKNNKKAFKETVLQECMFAAARQSDRRLTQQAFSELVKNWLRYAPWRVGGKKRN
ncbi:uncharacterized protein LOC132885396 isoform X2 [Neoarius graeffei]|nr:uncharacterized protein LOC132885396 isoform X2 [Neoarius graeffei]